MPWEISRILIDPAGNWGAEFMNVSGSTLDTGGFQFAWSQNNGVIRMADGESMLVPDGGTVIFGDTDFALSDILFAANPTLDAPVASMVDAFWVDGDNNRDNGVIDSVGSSGSSSATWNSTNTIYTAIPTRSPDTVYNDAFTDIDTNPDWTSSPFCFLAGTAIATPSGPCEVQNLKIGDRILTRDGREVPVLWIGRQKVSTRFGPADRLVPVRITAGALGNGQPHRDLVLTADHALLIDGLLINSGALRNGTTITDVPLSQLGGAYTVYHVETEAHEIILAEGVPAETFIDYQGRQAFDNYDEYVALYGNGQTLAEAQYPRVSTQRLLPAYLRRHLRIPEALDLAG